mmetsp:Transcript_9861/g.22066  ORF Transcript_9861/g.22066 Transcript_9861/m.22066 type:complete len:849 (-) Transcript_9861:157-2703(-)
MPRSRQTAEAAAFWDAQRSRSTSPKQHASNTSSPVGAAASASASAASEGRSLDELDLRVETDLRRFVAEVHKSVEDVRHARQSKALKAALETSRDAVLKQARSKTASTTTTSSTSTSSGAAQRVFPRLPSNSSAPPEALAELYCMPCAAGSAASCGNGESNTSRSAATASSSAAAAASTSTKDDDSSIVVNVRSANKMRHFIPQVASPPLYLEGTHPTRPPSTATVFLRKHYVTEDEQSLKYVPYFGDDDKEDVVSELFDINHRAKLMEFGPEYEERDMNDEIDETLLALVEEAGERIVVESKNGSSSKRKESSSSSGSRFGNHDEAIVLPMNEALSDIMDIDVKRVNERYKLLGKSCNNDDIGSITGAEATGASASNDEDDETSRTEETRRSSATAASSYEEVMDSYRNLFCRRCCIYDCNTHGNLPKPNIHLQGELAVQREKDGYWDKSDTLLPEDDISSVVKSDSMQIDASTPSRKRTRSSMSAGDALSTLTPLQASICERVYLMFQGDVDKMASAMGADRDLVERYVTETKMTLTEPTLLTAGGVNGRRRKDTSSEYTSMKNYNVSWLKNVQDAEIHPAFMPCDHEGPCNEETCSCVRNAFFCTKHCIWGERSRNFFRGCACKGNCNTKSCACFAAKRECDPDLCRSCGACSDPPNKPATEQTCKNDSLSMRRHAHLLVAESTVPDAGWGLFTKHALKKGDFVHEYVGEVISQEEAERRGRIYDKLNRSYLFNMSSDYVVDASRKGNKTKYANHSSKPNCYTKTVMVNGDSRIGLFAKCDVEAQSELFFDYRYDVGIDNDLIIKPAQNVDWMNDPKMANKVSKPNAGVSSGCKQKGTNKKHSIA